MAAARFNTAEHRIFDQHVICLAGDGCMQEGVASEAGAFAGHFGLDNLILIYDSNAVTLDAPATATQSEDTGARFKAYGFDVQEINEEDMQAFLDALNNAKENNNGRPKFIISHSLIGKGIPEVAGTYKAHGEAGAKFVDAGRKELGLPDEHYFVSKETYAYFAEHKKKLLADYERWEKTYNEWRNKNPELAKMLDNGIERNVPKDLLSKIPEFPKDAKLATRKAGSEALQPIAQAMPLLMSGSADLHGSTLNYIKNGEDFTRENPKGRNIRFGIREHGMCAILNGISYHGLFRASGATFTVFTDYCRASIRLAALAKLPNAYIFTHDSIGVGEDGPTHEPVETISSVRVMPNIDVIRPADPEETAGAFVAAMERTDGPTLIALTRQVVPILNDDRCSSAPRRSTARRLHCKTRERAAGTDHSVVWERIAARARGGERTRGRHACRFDAMHGTFQSRIGGISRRSFAEKCPQTRRDRSRRPRNLVSIRRPRRESDRPAPFRPERARRGSDEGIRNRCAACDRRGEITVVIR